MSSAEDPHEAELDSAEDAAGAESRRRRLVTLLGTDPTATVVTAAPTGPARDPAGDSEPGAGLRPGRDGAGVEAALTGDGLRERLTRLCSVTVSELGVDGAGVTVMGSTRAGRAGHRDQLAASGALTRQLEDLQLTTGEGPCLDAHDAGAPVLVGDLAAETTRWLGFGPEAIAAGATAVFSLPLQVGAVRLGTLDLHRTTAGSLGREQLADALMLAGLATETLLELVGDHQPPQVEGPKNDPDAGVDGATSALLSETAGWLPDVHADVHVASGMVSAQTQVDVGTALLRIRAFAFTHSQPIHQVARRIIDRELILRDHDHDDPEDGPPGPGAERDR